ncbi:MAG: DoxX family membrane protein, partial [Cyanobacteriota bacterium]
FRAFEPDRGMHVAFKVFDPALLLAKPSLDAMRGELSIANRIGRVLLCQVFVYLLIGKLTGFAGPAAAIAAKGLPLAPLLLVAAILLMATGSALVISGWRSRLGAVLLLVFLVTWTPETGPG